VAGLPWGDALAARCLAPGAPRAQPASPARSPCCSPAGGGGRGGGRC
jgi:hypothetical protein